MLHMCKGSFARLRATDVPQECQGAPAGGAPRGSSSSPTNAVKSKCPKTTLASHNEALENALYPAEAASRVLILGDRPRQSFLAQVCLSSSALAQSD